MIAGNGGWESAANSEAALGTQRGGKVSAEKMKWIQEMKIG